ncbi:hypothetical protein [Leeuwenhoekiella parthenopeia]|uniref:Glycosyltransferase RgtA/B/C/D-like domain-containing protein n=1 Tax=Leeuwenhoekiella parthenopeia TaxID=2890320 RepID=A0ABS8GZA8_9FLAO|nr:hypothetical protein [Leeuwenhoekiella parthenopeia]MCC4214426.1 hypothetical protein [Leeuwenhoekiella parthenopeia]
MKRIVTVFFIGILISAYYIGVGFYQQFLGFQFLEPLFLTDRLQLLFTNDVKTLELFYFTYPSLTHLINIPAAFINPLWAPLITSGIVVGFFAAHIIVELFSKQLKTVSVLVTIYFLTSPVILSIAISGTYLYLFLILYYLFFNFLFRYTRDYTSYNFVMISLCLTLFVLLDYTFLWIIIFIIPVIFLFSLFNFKGYEKSYIGIFEELTQNRVSARELLNKSLSTLLVILFTPVISFVLFLIINFWFTGDFMFFADAKTTMWNSQPELSSIFYQREHKDSLFFDGWKYSVTCCFLLSAPFLLSFLIGRKKLLFQIILFLVPIWLLYKMNSNPLESLPLEDLLIITAAGIAGFIHLFQTPLIHVFRSNKLVYLISFALLCLCLISEYYYFDFSKNPRDENMLSFLKQEVPFNTIAVNETVHYIQENIPRGSKILTDNSLTYPVSALTRNAVHYIDQFDTNYYLVLQNPSIQADYVLIVNTRYYDTQKGLKNKVNGDIASLPLIYQNEVFSILKSQDKNDDFR